MQMLLMAENLARRVVIPINAARLLNTVKTWAQGPGGVRSNARREERFGSFFGRNPIYAFHPFIPPSRSMASEV